jgi:hypothetical protein
VFGGGFAAMELTIRHFVWWGVSVLRLDGIGERDSLAVTEIMSAGCEAAPEDALAALRVR